MYVEMIWFSMLKFVQSEIRYVKKSYNL